MKSNTVLIPKGHTVMIEVKGKFIRFDIEPFARFLMQYDDEFLSYIKECIVDGMQASLKPLIDRSEQDLSKREMGDIADRAIVLCKIHKMLSEINYNKIEVFDKMEV